MTTEKNRAQVVMSKGEKVSPRECAHTHSLYLNQIEPK